MDSKDLANRFKHHSPKPGQSEKYDAVRALLLSTATEIVALTPPSPEQTLAIRKLEETMFWANASIARNGN